MLTSRLKGRLAKLAVISTAAGLALPLLTTTQAAHADPAQVIALQGVGSDTTQDVMNALAGASNGNSYTPVKSSAASGFRQLASWDAVIPAGENPPLACIAPKGTTFNRPNGSGAGRRAVSRAIDGGKYGNTTNSCTVSGGNFMSGAVDFARSSGGPGNTTGTELTFVPFARDGLGFAYYAPSGVTAVTQLTKAQLQQIFTSGPILVGSTTIQGCAINSSSGTWATWLTKMGTTDSTAATATQACQTAPATTTRVEENDGSQLKAKGDALGNVEVVTAHSAASFIAQWNAFAPNHTGAGVDMGSIDNAGTVLGKPYSGTIPATPTAGSLTASSTFYNDTTFGRDVYNVFDSSLFTGLPAANQDVKTLFIGSSSAVCSATSTITNFGFLSLGASCGSTTLKGGLEANNGSNL
jgi:hypothetical protein